MNLFGLTAACKEFGFAVDGLGAHSSRTLMLTELRALLDSCPPVASADELRLAVVEQNVLGKRTLTTRLKSHRYLRELYALDPEVLLYRALRQLWDADATSRPLLAVLASVSRDPSLRGTAGVILETRFGESMNAKILAAAVHEAFPQLKADTAAKIGRNAASTWTQSGHLVGRTAKVRTRATCRPAAVAYGLLLGYLCGARGAGLFETPCCQLLDAPAHILREQAFAASQQGWLEYRHTGMVTEITFHHLLRGEG